MNAARRAMWTAGTPLRAVLTLAIRAYQVTLSGVMGGQCRFYPTCSSYGLEAIRTHGAVKGSVLTVWRILRCSPLTAGGIDRVPPRRAGHPGEYDGILQEAGEQAC